VRLFVEALRTKLGYDVAIIVALTIVLLPLFVTQVPPIADYPNHLARMLILAQRHDPYLSLMYEPDWHLIPNLAIDLIMPPLLNLMPLDTAGRLVLAAALVLPVLGVLALHRALHGCLSIWPLASSLIACNLIFLIGLLNFLIGVGIALLTAAGWTALHSRRPVLALALLMVGAVATFFCHVISLFFLGIVIACTIIEFLLSDWRRGLHLMPSLGRYGGELMLGFAVPAWLYLNSPLRSAHGTIEYASAKLKLTEVLSPVLNYYPVLDVVTGGLIGLSLLALVWANRKHKDVLPLRIGLSIAFLLLLFVMTPFRAKGGAWFDVRFFLMATLLAFVGPRFSLLSPTHRAMLISGLGVLLIVRSASVAGVWYEHEEYVRSLQHLVARVPPGARVLVARVDPQLHKLWWHGVPPDRRIVGFGSADDNLPVLLLTERRAFTPLLFADPSQQPIRVRDPYRAWSIEVGQPPDYSLLGNTHPSGEAAERFPYLRNWPEHFDFVLVLDSDGAPDLLTVLSNNAAVAARIMPEAGTDVAVLFRVCHLAPCMPTSGT
jgi:hypothetical protein